MTVKNEEDETLSESAKYTYHENLHDYKCATIDYINATANALGVTSKLFISLAYLYNSCEIGRFTSNISIEEFLSL